MKIRTKKPKSPRSLTATLAVAFLVLSVVVLLISSVLQAFSSLAAQQEVIAGKLQLLAQAASQPVSSFIRDKFRALEIAAGRDNLPAKSAAEQKLILESLLGTELAFRQLVTLNAQDQPTAQASRLSQAMSGQFGDLLSAELFAQVREGQPYISSVYIDPNTSEPLIFVAVPIKSALGDFIGTLAGEVNLKFMWDVVDQLKVGEGGLAYVIDEQGNLIAFNDTARVLRGENVQTLQEVKRFIGDPSSTTAGVSEMSTGILGTTVMGTYAPLGTPPWAVVTELPWQEAYRDVIQQILVSIGITVVISILAGLLGAYLARRLAKPLVSLTGTATRIADGEIDLQAAVSGPGEVTRLAAAFNSMTGQLRSSIGNLEQRVADRTKALATSTEVSRRLSTILDREQLVRAVVEQMQSAFGYYHTQIYLTDPTGQSLIMAGGTGEAGTVLLARGHSIPKGKGLVGRAAETNAIVLVSDTAANVEWLPNPLLPETKSELAVPIALGDQVIGVLDVQHNIANGLTQNDADLIQAVANQVGVALQNARLFDQTQAALASAQDSQSALNEAMVVASMASWKLSFETFRFTFNDRLYAMLGTTAEAEGGYELSAEDYTKKYIHPEDAGLIAGAIQTGLQSPDPQNFKGSLEYRLIRQDGQIRYMLTDYRLVVDEQGRAVGGVGSFLDITERKLAEEALRRNEAQLSEALKIAKLGYWEYDVARDLFQFNDQFYALFHTTVEQAGGYQVSSAQYAQNFVHPDDAAVVGSEIGKGLASTDRHYSHPLEHRICYADGSVGYISVNFNIDRDEQGQILRCYGANQDITERKQVEEAIAKRAAELATVAEVSTTTATTLEPERLLQSVVDLTKERFGLYHAHIYLLDADGDSLTLTAGAGEVGRKMVAQGWQIPLDREQSLVARAARTRQGVIINDVRAEPDFMPNELLPETRAEMAVPVIAGDKVLGVFDVQSDQPGSFSQEDVSIYITLAAQVGVALQNAHSYSEVREQGMLTRTIIDSTPDWIFIKDQDHRYQLVNQGYASSLHLTPEDFIGKNDLELGFPEELVKGNPEKGIDGFWADDRRVMDGGETKIIPNDLVMIDNVHHNFNTIKTPLRDAAGSVWGVLAFGRDITDLMKLEAVQSKRASQLTTVSDVSTAVAVILSPEKLLQTVVDVTKERFGLYHTHIYLLDIDGDSLTLTAGAGEVGQKMMAQDWQIPLDREQSLVARAARTRQGVIINDVRAEPDFLPNELLPETRAEMAVPVIAGDKVLGVFDVQSDQPGSFSQEDTSIYTTLAAQVGIALQNARLFGQTQSALAQSEKLFNASRGLTQAADLQELVKTVVETLSIPAINRATLEIFDYTGAGELEGMTLVAKWWDGRGSAGSADVIGEYYSADEMKVLSLFLSTTPLFFNDTFNDERVDPFTLQVVNAQNIRAGAVLPLFLGMRQLGFLLLIAEEPHNFTQDEIRLYSAMAPQIATVLENRRQFERAQKQAERESTLNVISQKIQGATTVEAALQIAARELGRALGAPLTIAQIGLKERDNGSRN